MGKLGSSNRFRELRIAARDGNRAAIRALLRSHGWPQLADEVRRGKPIPPRVHRQVLALVAGTGTHDQLDEWEYLNEAGEIISLLNPDPPPLPARVPRPIFED